jgi:hypothetical protein
MVLWVKLHPLSHSARTIFECRGAFDATVPKSGHQIIYLSREIHSEESEWLAGMIIEARMLPIRKSSDFRESVAMRPCVEPEKRIPERSTNNHPPYFRLPTTWRASYYAWYSISMPFQKSDRRSVYCGASFISFWCVDEVRWLRRPIVSAELLALVEAIVVFKCHMVRLFLAMKLSFAAIMARSLCMRSYPGFKLLSQIFECRKVHIRGHKRGAKELYYSDKRVLIGSLFFGTHCWTFLFNLGSWQWLKWIS